MLNRKYEAVFKDHFNLKTGILNRLIIEINLTFLFFTNKKNRENTYGLPSRFNFYSNFSSFRIQNKACCELCMVLSCIFCHINQKGNETNLIFYKERIIEAKQLFCVILP